MSSGIGGILSRIAIPDKIADVQERAGENRQIYITAETQKESDNKAKTVINAEKSHRADNLKKEREKKQDKKKDKDGRQDNCGSNLDVQA